MAQEGFKRKVSAILIAYVEDRNHMMRTDGDSTIRTLATYRFAISNVIQKSHGHVVDGSWDNLLSDYMIRYDIFVYHRCIIF
jgi:hypothetical protein